ncbi:hypothetical protein B0H63DRAFT_463373 [Podospora didyma]|uniref:Uncharacterized protein n=1 Tax=Podospora didyma TaxID=330526 RepID=A0AAE0NXD8_9PEZI|nr:hypothetical protein B0H63DRAFT_463373 [Podospora didyma]
MATSTAPAVRYSTAKVATSKEAQAFSWEAPVPVNRFWDDFDYCLSRNFLGNFTNDELRSQQSAIDPDSEAPKTEKLELLLRLLEEKLATEEEVSVVWFDAPLHVREYKRWQSLVQGIYTMQDALDRLDDAEKSIRLLVDRCPPGGGQQDENGSSSSLVSSANVGALHMLGDHLVKMKKFVEAEETALPVREWMDASPKLGRDSPQALGSRRIILRALWGQGPERKADAEAVLAEIYAIIEDLGTGTSRFSVYQEEEKEIIDKMVKDLAPRD